MRKFLCVFALLITPVLASASDGVPMEPGEWEMTMTMNMSLLPKPQTKTENVCIEDEEFTPEDFNQAQNSPCDLAEIEVDGDTMRWSVSCPGPAGTMTGSWEFTSNGDTVTGTGEMSASVGEMSMEMNMEWQGKRIGDCD